MTCDNIIVSRTNSLARGDFKIFTARRYASAVYLCCRRVSFRLFARLSVTSRHCT